MIPKTIHYCWFGGKEKPKLAQKCIQSWKKYCSDYDFIEWNERNFDVHQNAYTSFLYDNKKYAFLSDYARLKVVYEYGGIYFDTDVEVIKNIDSLLVNDAFYGFENNDNVATGLGFGAVKGHLTVKKMMDAYQSIQKNEDGTYPLIVCPAINTKALEELGLKKNGKMQFVEGALILPEDYLNPYDDPTGRLRKTNNTVSIHWYAKSWMSKRKIIRSTLTKPLHRLFGTDFFRKRRNRESKNG